MQTLSADPTDLGLVARDRGRGGPRVPDDDRGDWYRRGRKVEHVLAVRRVQEALRKADPNCDSRAGYRMRCIQACRSNSRSRSRCTALLVACTLMIFIANARIRSPRAMIPTMRSPRMTGSRFN